MYGPSLCRPTLLWAEFAMGRDVQLPMEMHSSVHYLFHPTYKLFYISFLAFFSASFMGKMFPSKIHKYNPLASQTESKNHN